MQEAMALNPSLCKRFSYIQGEKKMFMRKCGVEELICSLSGCQLNENLV